MGQFSMENPGHFSVEINRLSGQPTMFPFSVGDNLGYVLSLSEAFDVRADSAGTRIVGLKAR